MKANITAIASIQVYQTDLVLFCVLMIFERIVMWKSLRTRGPYPPLTNVMNLTTTISEVLRYISGYCR